MENLSNMASPDDEAGERLVGNDEKNGKSSKEKPVEVKYMTPDSQNGDAKIDIENLKTAFAGMGKEELMKYANDPFWVKMRWFLFVLFWLIWIAMLAGAIAIIVLAPKCSAPTPREWWEQSPMYQVDVRSFKDGGDPQDGVGDLKGLESKLDYVKGLGVQTVVLSSILKSAPDSDSKVAAGDLEGVGGHVIDYKDIDPSIGTIQQFKQLANAMKDKGLHLLMSFVPNHSSDEHPWFVKSIKGTEPFKDYYIWAPPKGYDPNDGRTPIPPNNWISVKGGSAWEWNAERKMFYLHQFDKSQPDFNFRNQDVVDYFIEVLKFWLENGVSGFHLDKVQYLLEDPGFRDEPASEAIGAIHDQYDYLKHIYTTDLETLSAVLQQWNKIPANNSGILSVTGMRPTPTLQTTDKGTSTSAATVVEDKKDNEESSVGQLFVRPQFFQAELTAESLRSAINSTLKTSTKPTWDFVCKLGTDCITEDMLPGIQVVSLMLPGTPITKSGSELGLNKIGVMPWDNSTNGGFTTADKPWMSLNSDYQDCNVAEQLSNPNSQLNLFKKLVKTRESPAIMHGVTKTGVLSNTVFTFTRIKSGNPGYLVAFNINKNATTVDLTQLQGVPDDLTVFARTPTIDVPENSTALSTARSSKLNGKEVSIEPYAAIVLQFVPKSSG